MPSTRTSSPQSASPLTIVPGPSVSFTLGGTLSASQPPARTGIRLPVQGSEELTLTVSALNWSPFSPSALPELPSSLAMSIEALDTEIAVWTTWSTVLPVSVGTPTGA